jgi:hypothetical protein
LVFGFRFYNFQNWEVSQFIHLAQVFLGET